jgi:hypothetical protein
MNSVGHKVVASGAAHADDVPALDDLQLLGAHQGGQRTTGVRPTGLVRARLDADTEDVRALAAAGELPPARDPVPAVDEFGRLYGEQAAGEGHIGPVGVQLGLGLQG